MAARRADLATKAAALEDARKNGLPEKRLAASSAFTKARDALRRAREKAKAKFVGELEEPKRKLETLKFELAWLDAEEEEAERLRGERQEARRKADAAISVEYGRFKDRTTTKTLPIRLNLRGSGKNHYLTAGAALSGRNPKLPPEKLDVLVESYSRDWIYLKQRRSLELILIADREKINSKIIAYESEVGDYEGGSCREVMTFELSAQEFRTVLKASHVDAQIGETEFSMGFD